VPIERDDRRARARGGRGDPDVARRHRGAGSAEGRDDLGVDPGDLPIDGDLVDDSRVEELLELRDALGGA
jgi:hypothetical protein